MDWIVSCRLVVGLFRFRQDPLLFALLGVLKIEPKRGRQRLKQVMKNLETSLPVPSVQELVRHGQLDTVPNRYIMDMEDQAGYDRIGEHDDRQQLHVPCIDMARLLSESSSPQQRLPELLKLQSACIDWGIFQVINHGVSRESLTLTKESVQEFFEFPLEEKRRWAQLAGSLEGYGQAFVTSEEQKLEWCDMIFLKAQPVSSRNLDRWPQNPPKFRSALNMYSEEMKQLASRLVKFLAIGLGIQHDLDKYSNAFKEGNFDVRMNCYPICPEPDKVLGISPHADMSGITMLMECGDMSGLQVLKDGKWVMIPPIDDAIVVNLGQIMEIISNGTYKAPEHRAVANKYKDRHSVVTFCYPHPSLEIGPSKEVLESSRSTPLFKTMSLSEYYHHFYNRKLEVPFLDSLKL